MKKTYAERSFLRGEEPSLSLTMIIKNEIATLERCLRKARPHVDEIVIVDTGSTDGSREVAQRFADVYSEIEWPGSFSEARNISLDLASGDYILILDGDEYIPNPLHWELVRQAIMPDDTVLVELQLYNRLPENQMVVGDWVWQERVFLNDPEIRYQGKVHNQIRGSIDRYRRRHGGRTTQAEAEIIHDGYALAAEEASEKYTPRLSLLEDEYYEPRSAQARTYYGFQLASTYVVLQRFEEALDVFDELDYSLLADFNEFYAHYLAAQAAISCGRSKDALRRCEAMLRLDREEPAALYFTGCALLCDGQFDRGMLMLIEACRMREVKGRDARFVMNAGMMYDKISRLVRQARLRDEALRFLEAYLTEEGEPSSGGQRLLTVLREAAQKKPA